MSLLRKFRCLVGAHYWLRASYATYPDYAETLKCFYCPATMETRA